MKIERRKFIKGMFAGLAMAAIPFIPKLPEIPVEEAMPEVPKPAQHRCKDYAPTVEIIEYTPGMKINYQDLSKKAAICDNCHHEPQCLLNGQKFERYGDGTGKFYPKQFDTRCMNKLYQNTIFGLEGGKI